MSTKKKDQATVRKREFDQLGQSLDWIGEELAKTSLDDNSNVSRALREATQNYHDSLILNEDVEDPGFTADPETDWPHNLTKDHR